MKLIIIFTLLSTSLLAKDIHVAVASNFASTFYKVIKQYKKISGDKVVVSFGSTGKLFAQIKNGAPYDLFLSADMLRPQSLEKEKIGMPGSRFTYAIGKLALWIPYLKIKPSLHKALTSDYHFLAIANPKLAPYGRAAREVLVKLKLWKKIKDKTVRGENISQAFNFIKSKNAQLGFVALSQLKNLKDTNYIIISDTYYSPIIQQAIVLKASKSTSEFVEFLKHNNAAQRILENSGYQTASKMP
jgi:molybdate transport system substrate-binding protein